MRMKPKDRKDLLLKAALKASVIHHYKHVTRQQIADEAGVSESLISAYFGTMCRLRRDIIRAAIREEELEVLAQALVAGDSHARKAPKELKEKAFKYFIEINK